tara:strand:- start:49 stop:702 length:654 start_codon:yes stop_codon:yes gene_type:complete
MNRYNPSTVFSSIDRNGRYSFKNQSRIAFWNLVVLANTLIPLITNNKKEAIVLIQNVLDSFNEKYTKKWYEMMFKKIGIIDPESNDNTYVDQLLKLMKIHNFDYTNLFASLTLGGSFIDKFYENQDFKIWYKKWVFRIRKSNNLEAGKDFMKNNNPLYIPRNYLVESALENAILKDCDKMKTLLSDISKSYSYDTFKGDLHTVPDNFDSSYVTYCGT